mgnify:CR=1 FL=1
MKRILIINGPNLNLLGKREPLLYGSESFETVFEKLQSEFGDVALSYLQKNDEGGVVEAIQSGAEYDAVVLNPAAFSHTSLAVADAVAAIDTPVIEVHISNVFARDPKRHHSYVSKYAAAVIVGAGLDGYRLGIIQALRF